MFRQTRSDVTASGYRLWAGLAVAGFALLWISLNHLGSLPVAASGGVVAAASTGQLYRRKSQSLIEACDHRFADPIYHDVEASVSPKDISPSVESFAQEAADHTEVESLSVRPSPVSEGQFVELQLNGGRMCGSLADAIENSRGTPRLREPSSEDYYTVFVLFDR